MGKLWWVILITLPLLGSVAMLILHLLQEKMIFLSYKLPVDYRFRFDTPFEERTFVPDEDIIIHALHFKAENPRGMIFYLHGNAGALDFWGGKAQDFVALGYDVLMIDYRGYGKSSGRIYLEHHLIDDAKFVLEEVSKEVGKENVIIYGISLGTGIATILAEEYEASKLLLETPYYHFRHVAKYHFPYLPLRFILKYRFRTDRHLPNVKCPVYAFHGTNDLTVPYRSSLMLQKIKPEMDLLTVRGGSHNDLNTFPEYHEKIAEILT